MGGGKGGGWAPYGSGKGGKDKTHSVKTPGNGPNVKEELGDFTGTIKSFSEKSGYGFIDCPDLKAAGYNDVFLHHKEYNGLESGNSVSFSAFLHNKDQPQAKDVQP